MSRHLLRTCPSWSARWPPAVLLLLPLISVAPAAGIAQETSPAKAQAEAAPRRPLGEKYFRLHVGRDAFTMRMVGDCGEATTRYVVLHGSEETAPAALRQHLQHYEGCALELVNPGQRWVSFRLGRRKYLFDPNRVFSRAGVEQNLVWLNSRFKRLHRSNRQKVVDEVEQFGQALRRLVAEPRTPGLRVVAVHNNGTQPNASFSFETFVERHGYFHNVQALHYRRDLSPYDLFLVNNPDTYEALSRRNLNVVLEDSARPVDDGSLSVFCSRAGIEYANIETRIGELDTQVRMLDTLREIWDTPAPESPAP